MNIEKKHIYFFIYFFIVGILGVFVFIFMVRTNTPKVRKIVGYICDKDNIPVKDAIIMLYKGEGYDKYVCSKISSKAGKFEISMPELGKYYFILSNNNLYTSTEEFYVGSSINIMNIKFVWSLKKQKKKIIEEEPRIKKEPDNTKEKYLVNCGLLLKIFPKEITARILSLTGVHLTQNRAINLKIKLENKSEYKIIMEPGDYVLQANIDGYKSIKNLEVYINPQEFLQYSLEFEKIVENDKSKELISLGVTVFSREWIPQIGVNVHVVQSDGDFEITGKTNGKGEIIFENIPIGEYEVKSKIKKGDFEVEIRDKVFTQSKKIYKSYIKRRIKYFY